MTRFIVTARKTLLTFGFAAVSTTTSIPISTQEPSVSSEEAQRKAVEFGRAVGAPIGPPFDICELKTESTGRQTWSLGTKDWQILVHARTGKVVFFNYDGLEREWRHARVRTGNRAFSSDAEARLRLLEIAGRIGLPENHYVSSLGSTEDNPALGVYGVYALFVRVRVAGKPFLQLGPHMAIRMDSQTGRVFQFQQDLDYRVETSEPAISEAQAIEIAERAYEAYNYRKERTGKGPVERPRIRMGYAVRNRAYGTDSDFVRVPYRSRLAYEIPFGPATPPLTEVMWIDAVTGEVLGGVLTR